MDDSTGSHRDEVAPRVLKKTLQLKARKPDTESLKVLGRILKKTQCLTLVRKYGEILDLLEVDVQVDAITAVTQFYDPPLRCFTFRDFQLAPTLEEFEQILGLSLEKYEKPYRYLGHYPSLHTIADVLKVSVKDLQEKKQNRNGIDGFSRKYLEEHLHHLAGIEDWEAFIDVLALTIYGILIFPNADEFVDFAAIDVFFARKFRGENPVPAILADVYYTLNFCHEKKGKRILCCLPMLFIWLTAHVFKRGYEISYPITEFHRYQLGVKSGREWAQILAQLDEKSVRWYPRWVERENLIYQCGDFPNVPLMGTRGCINYNPSLARRQLGYPMRGAPTEEMITPFVLYDMNPVHNETLKRVRDAWNNVIRMGKELKTKNCGVQNSYRQWVTSRAREVKLPFQALTVTTSGESSMSASHDNEEIREIQGELVRVEEEKKKIEVELKEARQRCETLEQENMKKNLTLERADKRAKIEENYMLKTKGCLQAANKELSLRRNERDEAITKSTQLEELLKNSSAAYKDSRRQMAEMGRQMEMRAAKYEDRLKKEKQSTEEVIMMYQDAIRREQEEVQRLTDYIGGQDEIIAACRHEVAFWMTRFSNLAEISNDAIKNIPNKLGMAEALVNPLTTPAEIRDFIEYCRNLIVKMKQSIIRRM
ncbi:uncharacterized protein LOC133315816 [Gastrolobium bilobum]|uniref:uncharacterized protein LOC133315816 n=1 Tax=Gastrolobium bilobum TaxID=150636 RepID=UPI002AB0F5E0|nr:uncharacterized protein LOC133315816 [Gastrolobium bilobum]